MMGRNGIRRPRGRRRRRHRRLADRHPLRNRNQPE
ncbi:hypothetical protein J2X01_002583 [Arthrobacter ginsengisoli]|uniref:Uncharacterized protein n=1 Tax=Arthrobacter ginsengisoli TaxID=1356565 RepID=A0ABU1UDL6_9MICC|nr:hypothetical protein [Arthrobacter ginsengisoli]